MYRLTIFAPAHIPLLQRTWVFDPASENVESIEVNISAESGWAGHIQAVVHDPKFEIFNALPDPSFFNVPAQVALSPVDGAPPSVAFEGLVTSLSFGYPASEKITIVAHDKSIKMRRVEKARRFNSVSSTRMVQAIAKEYDLKVDLPKNVRLQTRDFVYGPRSSDWDLLVQVLRVDGLELVVEGGRLAVRVEAVMRYPKTFKRGEYPVISLEGAINHVPASANKSTSSNAFENKDTAKAATESNATTPAGKAIVQAAAAEQKKQQASSRTDRRPIGSAAKPDYSHSEDMNNRALTGELVLDHRRKDEATLTVALVPDLAARHFVKLEGWGKKIDGDWHVMGIRHHFVGGDFPKTDLTLKRGPSEKAKKGAGVDVPLRNAETRG